MMKTFKMIATLLLICMMLSGCARSPSDLLRRDGVTQSDRDSETGSINAKHDEEQRTGYQFYTRDGEIVTILNNPTYHWYVPTSYLNMNISAVPVEYLTSDNIVVSIGFADKDTAESVDDNVYKILYTNMLDSFIKDLGRGEAIREKLVNSLGMYKVEQTEIAGKTVTKSIADYTFFDNEATSYQLPCLQTSIPIGDEKVVIFVQASTDTGLWDRTVLPTPFELELGQDFSVADKKVLQDVKSQCSRFYKKLESYMAEAIELVTVGEADEAVRIVSLNYTNNYGINVSRFNKYCFLKLVDGSVYLLYEKDNMHAAEFITGNNQHRLTTDWTQFKKEVTDEYDGTIYEIEWQSSGSDDGE